MSAKLLLLYYKRARNKSRKILNLFLSSLWTMSSQNRTERSTLADKWPLFQEQNKTGKLTERIKSNLPTGTHFSFHLPNTDCSRNRNLQTFITNPPGGDEDEQPFKTIPAGVAVALMINQSILVCGRCQISEATVAKLACWQIYVMLEKLISFSHV